MLRLSFDSARVVKLRPTVCVLLRYKRHRILGVQGLFLALHLILLSLASPSKDLYPDMGTRYVFCMP